MSIEWIMSFKLGDPLNPKKVSPFWNITFWIWIRTKVTCFNVMGKQQKSRSLPFFLQKSSMQNQKSTFTVKFSPSVLFCVLIHVLGWGAAFCSSVSWPCLHFQLNDCNACWEIARIFSTTTLTHHRNFTPVVIFSGHKFQNILCWVPKVRHFATSQIPKQSTTPLLTSLRKWTISYCHAQWCPPGTLRDKKTRSNRLKFRLIQTKLQLLL